jgi:flagellar biosynthesis/type III secretory pathway chaperone
VEELMADLRALLGEQVKNLRSLESIIRAQRNHLAGRDIPGIISSITEQGQCLERVHRVDQERKRLMGEISKVLGLGPGEITVTRLSTKLDGEVGEELRATAEAIRETLENIGRVNRENKRLIQHSLKVVQEMLGAVTGERRTPPTYGDRGLLRPQQQDRMLVDKTT